MIGLLEPLVPWVQLLLRATWQATLLAMLVLLIHRVMGNRISARARYAMWLLVVLRLLLPVTPQTPWSIHNLWQRPIPQGQAPVAAAIADILVLEPALVFDSAPEARMQMAPAKPSIPIELVLCGLWLVGAVALTLRIAWSSIRLSRQVRRLTPVRDDAVLTMLSDCCTLMRIRRPPRIASGETVPAPALFGVLRPRLLLPQQVLRDFSPRELRLIILHELAHLKRRDVVANWVLAAAQVLHWFNPFVWLMMSRIRSDRELACDERVLSLSSDGEAYGQTIVRLLEILSRQRVMPHVVGILENRHRITRRITMIAQFHRTSRRWTALAAVLALTLGCMTLTDAVQGEPKNAAAEPAARAPEKNDGISAQEAQDMRMLHTKIKTWKFDAVGFSDVIDYLHEATGGNVFVNWRALEAAGIDRTTPVTINLSDVTYEQALRYVLRDVGGGNVKLGFVVDDGVLVISTDEELGRHTKVRTYDISDLLPEPATQPVAHVEPGGQGFVDPMMGAPGEMQLPGGGGASIPVPGGYGGLRGVIVASDMQHMQLRNQQAVQLIQLIVTTIAPDTWRNQPVYNQGAPRGGVGNIHMFGDKLVVIHTEDVHGQIKQLLEQLREEAQ